MKKEINPIVIAISAIVLLGVIAFIATRVFAPATPTEAAVAPPTAATINGHPVPAGAPTAAFQKAKEQAGGK